MKLKGRKIARYTKNVEKKKVQRMRKESGAIIQDKNRFLATFPHFTHFLNICISGKDRRIRIRMCMYCHIYHSKYLIVCVCLPYIMELG